MNNDDILNIGDWVYEDGYGIVEKISPLYWDIYNHEIYQDEEDKEFDRELNPDEPAKELGNLRAIELQIKRFCDYKGVPIRRNRTVVRWKEYSRHIKAKDLRLIQKAQKNYPKEYESFLKLNKRIEGTVLPIYQKNRPHDTRSDHHRLWYGHHHSHRHRR